jgi:hypothetical protein
VDVAATRIEAIRRFRTRMGHIDHKSLNSRRAIDGPAITIVTSLKQCVERDSRIEVGRLRYRSSVLELMKLASPAGDRYPRTRTIQGQNQPDPHHKRNNNANQ